MQNTDTPRTQDEIWADINKAMGDIREIFRKAAGE
jgi:hypothetical protein